VDTGGQEAFVTEGTEKRSDTITANPPTTAPPAYTSIFYKIKFCTSHPLFLTEQKLRITFSSALSKALSYIPHIFFFILLRKSCGTV
jgi:hypothetical protein